MIDYREAMMTLETIQNQIAQAERNLLVLAYSDDYCYSNGNYDAARNHIRSLERLKKEIEESSK